MYIGLSLQNADESNLVALPNQSQNDIQLASTNLRKLPSPIIDFSIPSNTFFGETAETMESYDRQCQNCKGIFKGGTGLATHMRSCGAVNGTAYRKFNRWPKIRKCMKCKKTFKGGTGWQCISGHAGFTELAKIGQTLALCERESGLISADFVNIAIRDFIGLSSCGATWLGVAKIGLELTSQTRINI
mgnify:CR=1 FL=1